MKKFFALIGISLKSMLLSSSGFGKKRKKAFSGLGVIAIIAGLGLYVSGLYSYLLLEILAPLRMESLLFIFMGLAALFSGVMFTTFAVKSTVFEGRDNDLMLSMPVSTTMLMLSRMLAIYLENLLFSFFLIMPAGVACALMSHSGIGQSIGFWLRLLVTVFSIPLLETALSVLLGACLALFSTKVTKKALGQNLIMGLYMAVVFWFAFNLNGMIAKLSVNAAGIKAAMAWVRPIIWMADGIMGSWWQTLAFAAFCIVPFALVTVGFGKIYRKAVTAFAARGARSDYKLSGQRSTGQARTLLAKEARRLVGSPVFFWNAVMGPIILVGGSIYLAFRSDLIELVVPMLGTRAVFLPIVMGIMGFCLCMTVIAAPSFSFEGKNLWILREAPVSESTLINVKTGFQIMLLVPCILICCICLVISGALTLTEGLLLLLFSLAFEVGHACFGMLMGLIFVRLDAANDAAIIKRSMLSFLSMFAPACILLAFFALGWIIRDKNQMELLGRYIYASAGGGALLMALISAMVLRRKGPALVRGLLG